MKPQDHRSDAWNGVEHTRKIEIKRFAGIQEHFDESILLLKRHLKWKSPPIYISQNVQDNAQLNNLITHEERQLILAYNKYDVSDLFIINLASSLICDILIVK